MENQTETHSLKIEELEQKTAKQDAQIAELSAKLKWYEEQFRLAQQKRFGAWSEKTHPDQLELNLLNEAEVLATPATQESTAAIPRQNRNGRPAGIAILQSALCH